MEDNVIVSIIALCISGLSFVISLVSYFRYYPRVKIDKTMNITFYQNSQHYEISLDLISKSSYPNNLLSIDFYYHKWKKPSDVFYIHGNTIDPFTTKHFDIYIPQDFVYSSKRILLKFRTCGRNTYKLINLKKSLLIDKSQQ